MTGAKTWYGSIPAFTTLGRGQFFGFLQYSVVILLVMGIILEFVLRYTRYGRYLYVLGLNEEAGRRAGVPVKRVKDLAFMFCGFAAGLAGLIMAARLDSSNASGAQGMDFNSIISVVLGGTALFGGSGGALRTLVGLMVLGILNNVMVLVGLPYEGQWVAKGLVFMLVVMSDGLFRRR